MITDVKNMDSFDNGALSGMTRLSSKDTYYYNNQENDKGDFTGRVGVERDSAWILWIMNYSETDVQSLKIEYGSAIQTSVAFLALAASAALTYTF